MGLLNRVSLASYKIITEFSSDTCPTVHFLSDHMSLFFRRVLHLKLHDPTTTTINLKLFPTSCHHHH